MKIVLTLSQTATAPLDADYEPLRWLTVGANLDPRFGGVSAIMRPLIRAVAAAARVEMSLAAFCQRDEDLSAIESSVGDARRYLLSGMKNLLLPSVAGGPLNSQIEAASGVHIHGLWQEHCALAARAARAHKKPYIVSAHGMLDPWALNHKRRKKQWYLTLIEKRNLQQAACLHALTPFEAESYRKLAPGVPVAIIPNGADVPGYADPERFLARFPALRNRRLALFLARIHPKKGLDILCEAWRGVSARWPDAHLVLAGPDSENSRVAIEAQIRSLGIEDRVTFTGMLAGADKWSALAAARVFVLPSYSEGLSVSVLEALGMGCPVVVSEQCHVAGIIENRCGWQIQPRAEEIESALDAVFALPSADARSMGAAGRALVKRSYSWSTIGARMSSLYAWVNGGPLPAEVALLQN